LLEVSEAPVLSEYFACPRDGVAYPDAGWLRLGPEFQILWPVIVSYAVAVVNGLRWQQVTA